MNEGSFAQVPEGKHLEGNVQNSSETTSFDWILAVLLVLLASWILRSRHFFKLEKRLPNDTVSLRQMLGAFFGYLICAILFVPLFNALIAYLVTGNVSNLEHLPPFWAGWLQLFSLFIIFLFALSYCFMIKKETRRMIFWGDGPSSTQLLINNLAKGALTCALSYPFVLLTGLLAGKLSLALWGKFEMQQVAVQQIKKVMEFPLLFSLMLIIVVFLVPFLEELLFRGFLQSFLKRYFGRIWAIFITAGIFAAVHYAPSQGVGNFQLLASLFILACFLGFSLEKEKSLWAPIGLHMTFNGLNILLIFFTNNLS